jgi:hypothetical protein
LGSGLAKGGNQQNSDAEMPSGDHTVRNIPAKSIFGDADSKQQPLN